MNIAITGSTGYIGSNLVPLLAKDNKITLLVRKKNPFFEHNKNIKAIVVNFNSQVSIKKALQNIEVVYHLAGALPNLPLTDKQYFDVNTKIAKRMYQTSIKVSTVKQFILCSTAYVTWNNGDPTNENSRAKGSNIYERSKLKGEIVIKHIAEKSGLPITIVRPGFVYGNNGLGLLSLCKAIKSKRFFYAGNGENLFELTHINDLSRFFVTILNNSKAFNQTFIVSSRHPLSFRNIAEIISDTLKVSAPRLYIPIFVFKYFLYPTIFITKQLNIPFPISLETYKTLTTPRSFMVDKASRILNFHDQVNHKLAIQKVVSWYMQKSKV